jgi:hypothetical protein
MFGYTFSKGIDMDKPQQHNHFCLYIQKISATLSDPEIIYLVEDILKLGRVSRYERVSKTSSYISAFVYFSFIFWTPANTELFLSVDNGKSYKLKFPQSDVKWILRKKSVSFNVVQYLISKIEDLEKKVEQIQIQQEQQLDIFYISSDEEDYSSFL